MNDSQVSLWSTDDFCYAEYSRALHRSFCFVPHVHDTICLALILRGTLQLTIGRRMETVGKGSLVVIDAGDVHAGHAASGEGWVMRTLHVSPIDFAARIEAAGLPQLASRRLRSGIHRDGVLGQIFFGIHACAQINDDRLKRDEQILRLIRRLTSDSDRRPAIAASGRHAAAADRARDFIASHLCDAIRLDDLARVAALPPYAIVRAFATRFGLPPHRYQIQRRIDLARRLIRGGQPLADVSHSCGFSDQAHFSRAFRRTLGYTPGFYAHAVA